MTTASMANAWLAHRKGNRDETMRLCREVLRANPNEFEALYLLGFVHSQNGQWDEAERLIGQAIVVNPLSADASYNRGCVLQQLNRQAEALACFDAALTINPHFLEAHINRGVALLALKRPTDALAAFDTAIELKPNDAESLNNRANALLELGYAGEALATVGKALALNANFADAWNNRGVILQSLRRHVEAFESFGKALQIAPGSFAALTNRGNALMELQRHRDALKDFERALQLKPDYVEAAINRGRVLTALKDFEGALASFSAALKLRPDSTEALFNRANTLMVMKRFEDAAADCEDLLKLVPDYGYALGFLAFFRLQCCDWRDLATHRSAIADGLGAGKHVIPPFASIALLTSESDQAAAARITVNDKYPAAPQPLWQGERYDHDKIRLAYLSGDFNNTAVANLIAGVFEHHDKERFDTVALSLSPSDGSPMRARLMRSFGRFVDGGHVSDAEVAAALRQNGIDIAVDLMGFTGNSRPGIFALKPAPVQINYLGFAGTMGADYIDYILADRIALPVESRQHYEERVVYLPDTFLPADSTRVVAERVPTRTEAGLPADGFVFCSFNNSYKFMPEMFDVWVRLLRGIDGSVFWMQQMNPAAQRNLTREAAARGVAAERLIFAPFVASSADHLARLSLADLFLDTLPYNAHSTAVDALMAGVPVLTTPGTTFAGRVGASLLHAAGLPEMVATSVPEYESLALELARNPASLIAIKTKLKLNRKTERLFDTERFTRNLESAYVTMWQRCQRGAPPGAFAVEPATP